MQMTESDVALVRRNVAHVAEESPREWTRERGTDLVLQLPQCESARRKKAALRIEVLFVRGVAVELFLLRGRRRIEKRDHAMRRYAQEREPAIGRRATRKEATEVHDLHVVHEYGSI